MGALRIPVLALIAALLALAGCSSSPSVDRAETADAEPRAEPPARQGNPSSYKVLGKRYQVRDSNAGYRERGVASWYGNKFHGRPTSSGEPYDMYKMTAAHKSLRLPAYVRVTNLENGRSVVVRVNDRGPFVGNRVIDLSYAAAHKIGMTEKGTALVDVEVVGPGQQDQASARTVSISDADSGNWGRSALPKVRWGENVFVQVGAFRDRENAEAVRARLKGAGIAPLRQEGGELTRLRVGPFDSQRALDDTMARLREMGFNDAEMVVKK
ncbi:septal ring lytic transglycosylase RlpA family protein [Guyparkeria sp.]|uniref:septal ring lytic transglycosylase RlpA family protein n=1 Tax=Guyparkeria sp. TaxID=2035736 RepID=UPI003970FB86